MATKLTYKKVTKIKEDICAGMSQYKLATKNKVSRSSISDIAAGRSWKQVPWPDGVSRNIAASRAKQPANPRGNAKVLAGEAVEIPMGEQKMFDPTDQRVLTLESEILCLRGELSQEKAKFRKTAKTNGIFQAMADELTTVVKPLPAFVRSKTKKTKKTKKRSEEHVVLHLSDGHHDQIVVPEECGGLETYNFPISCRRAETLVDTTVDWTRNYLGGSFKFPVLWVLAYGDHTSGEIHGHVHRSYYRNQFKNSFAIGQLHALMYRDLSEHFDEIKVVYVPGNHGRRSVKKDHHGAHDNWDYLVAEIARLHCADLNNIEFLIPNSYSINLDINGIGFNISHGDDVRGSLGLPYYGLQRRQRNLAALEHATSGPRVRYNCCGHFHKPGTVGDMDGEMIVNGPWLATDAYCFNSFAGYTEPSQWLHGVKPSHGVTWRLGVQLRGADDHKGPKRYKIELE